MASSMLTSFSKGCLPLLMYAALMFDGTAAFAPVLAPISGAYARPGTVAPRIRPVTRPATLRVSATASMSPGVRGTGVFQPGGQAVVLEHKDLEPFPADAKALVVFSGGNPRGSAPGYGLPAR